MTLDAPTDIRPAGRARAFLQLLRPANVATSAADVLAGAAVATGGTVSGRLGWLVAASACLYAGGIVFNDYFDRAIDARERPERPIPSGRIQPARAAAAGGMLLAAGVVCALVAGAMAGPIALAIAGAVLSYDAWSKHQAWAGPLNMGACRALNLMLGMSMSTPGLAAWPLAVLPLAYIAAVTVVSRGEVFGSRKSTAGLSAGVLGCVLLALAAVAAGRLWRTDSAGFFTDPQVMWTATLFAWLVWRLLPAFLATVRDPSPGPIRRAVRTGVLSLVLVNGVIAAAYAGIIYSLAVLATGLLAWWLARRFAVT